MRRVPLLSGSRVVQIPVGEEDIVLAPPSPPARTVDVAAAIRDALRFPLDGRPFSERVPRTGRVTVVIEPPALPVPGAQIDPRPRALATVLEELTAEGVEDDRRTILIAGGLSRKLPHRELERILPPPEAREYRGRVLVHDACASDLAPLELADGTTAGVHRALVEAELVVAVSSAESVVAGGPAALASACDAATVRRLA
jgi:nickel-dependent lactate racemase